jgi:hypothetical protein
MDTETVTTAPDRPPNRRRRMRVAIGATILAVTVAGTVVAQGPIQPPNPVEPVPYVEPEILPQPKTPKTPPAYVEPAQIPQPANPHPKVTGQSTQVSGPREKAVGVDGQGGSSKRKDTGGVNGADRSGGRTD